MLLSFEPGNPPKYPDPNPTFPGGGVKGGTIYGATDELGYHAVEKPCTVYDLWATVLHLCGLDHERLTYRYAGRDVRLTDVHGRVLSQVVA